MKKRDVVIALSAVGFMLVTAILSYFYGHHKVLKFIAGGERLFRLWIVVLLVVLGVEGILRIIRKRRGVRR